MWILSSSPSASNPFHSSFSNFSLLQKKVSQLHGVRGKFTFHPFMLYTARVGSSSPAPWRDSIYSQSTWPLGKRPVIDSEKARRVKDPEIEVSFD